MTQAENRKNKQKTVEYMVIVYYTVHHLFEFPQLTCYMGACNPRRFFSSHTCPRSCGESHCAATLGSSLYLPQKRYG